MHCADPRESATRPFADGAFEAIVDRKVFEAAQALIAEIVENISMIGLKRPITVSRRWGVAGRVAHLSSDSRPQR